MREKETHIYYVRRLENRGTAVNIILTTIIQANMSTEISKKSYRQTQKITITKTVCLSRDLPYTQILINTKV